MDSGWAWWKFGWGQFEVLKLECLNPEDAAEESAARDSQQAPPRTEAFVGSLASRVALPIIPLAAWDAGRIWGKLLI